MSESEISSDQPPGIGVVKVQLAEAHTKVFDAFSRAFNRQNSQFEKAIRSLDSLNDQIVEFVLKDTSSDVESAQNKQRGALVPAVTLMRQLLLDAQAKFRKMVEENQQLATRIDSELQSAHQEVSILRNELADTNKRISEMQAISDSNAIQKENAHLTNGTDDSSNQVKDEMLDLRRKCEVLEDQNKNLLKELEDLRFEKELDKKPENGELNHEVEEVDPQKLTLELSHAREALAALKNDRKRLKSEKLDLLSQMKQLYATLEDKEKELRHFIRNYEQRMRESEESLKQLSAERDESEREKWNLLKHARDEAERSVSLSTQLGIRDATVRKLEEDIDQLRKRLSGSVCSTENERPNGDLPSPSATPSISTPTCSPIPLSVCNSTTNGRGSSADSGVRISDKESNASHDDGQGTPSKDGSAVIYSTPKNTVTPRQLSRHAVSMDSPGYQMSPIDTSSSNHSDLASFSSGVANNNLSMSAEQLCDRIADAAESSVKPRGTQTLSRKGVKSGTWGSISRVFARQKKRAALENSLFDSNPSDKRASWSPTSSCVSPMSEASYAEKIRLLEEAQHLPLERWRAATVLAWLEITLGMPQYGALCAENVRSGKILMELNDQDLELGLGITHPMHRKKLRLAIEELREPRMRRFPKISVLNHQWVASEWLNDIGLPQYSDIFASCLVDGRMLEAITKKELEKHLGVTRKFHQASMMTSINLLRIVHYDRHLLHERRRASERVDNDPIVWTNYRWVRWARAIELQEWADNLKESGVHGALVVLEHSFTADTMATALGVPSSKVIIRKHLAREFENLIFPARKQMDEQAKFAKLERRRREKSLPGGSLGRSFGKYYATLDRSDKERRRGSLRGSLSRALGLKVRDELAREDIYSNISPPRPLYNGTLQPRPRSSVVTSTPFTQENHRRVRSISDIDHITITPV